MNTVPVLVSLGTAVAVGAVVISGLSALGLRGEIERLEARLPERPDPGGLGGPREPSELGDPAPEWARMARVLEDLERRLARLEARPGRELVPAVVEPVKSGPPEKDVALRAEMEELLGLFADGFDWNGDTEKLQRFYELAHETDLIDEKIAELEAGVAANPGDLERRMQLADTYVAKLMTIQGPEQGLWGLKAEQEWRTIVDLDENHWESTFNLGNNYAYYPDVMGKTDDAIAYLERARAIQERSTQSDEHVQTYLSLARMHQRKGELEQARQVLEAGLTYHPGNADLEAALASLG